MADLQGLGLHPGGAPSPPAAGCLPAMQGGRALRALQALPWAPAPGTWGPLGAAASSPPHTHTQPASQGARCHPSPPAAQAPPSAAAQGSTQRSAASHPTHPLGEDGVEVEEASRAVAGDEEEGVVGLAGHVVGEALNWDRDLMAGAQVEGGVGEAAEQRGLVLRVVPGVEEEALREGGRGVGGARGGEGGEVASQQC